MILAIVGSRSFNDYNKFKELLFSVISLEQLKICKIVSGEAIGTDTLAKRLTEEFRLEYLGIPVTSNEWRKYGKQAGMLRNQKIIDSCDTIIVFWDGVSSGTKDTLEKAKISSKNILQVFDVSFCLKKIEYIV